MEGDTEMQDREEVSASQGSFGRRLLQRYGWKEGEGLGAAGDGMAEPVQVEQRIARLGLGAECCQQRVRGQRASGRGGDGGRNGGPPTNQQVDYDNPQQRYRASLGRWGETPSDAVNAQAVEGHRVFSDMQRSAENPLYTTCNLAPDTTVSLDEGRWLLKWVEQGYLPAPALLSHTSILVAGLPALAQLRLNCMNGSSNPITYTNNFSTLASSTGFGGEEETGLKSQLLARTYNWRAPDDRTHWLANANPQQFPRAQMAEFEDNELQSLNAQVLAEPEEFEHWEKLVRAAESQEGGLGRNSSPQAIAATRDVYDRFLARFPLFFGYWKKYADLEFSIVGTEAAEMVYERGVASVGTSVDLWANYCGFKTETTHDLDMIRELFERGAESVGLDFMAHPFWDKYLEFEERMDAHDKIFSILQRIVYIPMHQYARYFERYRTLSASRPVSELAPADVIARLQGEMDQGGMKMKNPADVETELRASIDGLNLEIFQRTQTETTKRWTYEQEVKRPYYHVTELDDAQLSNWRKYLDFEEAEGDYTRTKFLYERCLVTAANYDEFWLRYVRWMLRQDSDNSKQQEVRNIYQRASCTFVPIARPHVRLMWAHFEEATSNYAIASDIIEAVLEILPSHLETIMALTNLQRRQHGVEAAIHRLRRYIDSFETSAYVRGALVTEWARLVAEINGQPDEARKIYESNQQSYLDCRPFWMKWFFFEVNQPGIGQEQQHEQYQRVKAVFDAIRGKSSLPPVDIKEMTSYYLAYLQERGPTDEAMKEFVEIDREINGPLSAQSGMGDNSKPSTNGHPAVDVNEAYTLKGRDPYPDPQAQHGGQMMQLEG